MKFEGYCGCGELCEGPDSDIDRTRFLPFAVGQCFESSRNLDVLKTRLARLEVLCVFLS